MSLPLRPSLLAVALAMLALLTVFCLGYPVLSGHDPEQMDMARRLALPGSAHWLGTDHFGRDLGARLAAGGRLSLLVGLGSVLGASAIGIAVGLLAGYRGGWLDGVLTSLTDFFLAFPAFVLALALVAVLGPGVPNLIVALIAVSWPAYARLTRALVLAERGKAYVAAARTLGAGTGRILLYHVLPNLAGPLTILASFGVGQAVIAEGGMSFLGLGVQPPAASWGWILAHGLRELRSDPWMSTATGLALLYTVLAFNLLGDGLRARWDAGQASALPIPGASGRRRAFHARESGI